MSFDFTVEDVLKAQVENARLLDKSKNCNTCKYSEYDKEAKPCSECINSFLGIVFTPSNYEPK